MNKKRCIKLSSHSTKNWQSVFLFAEDKPSGSADVQCASIERRYWSSGCLGLSNILVKFLSTKSVDVTSRQLHVQKLIIEPLGQGVKYVQN